MVGDWIGHLWNCEGEREGGREGRREERRKGEREGGRGEGGGGREGREEGEGGRGRNVKYMAIDTKDKFTSHTLVSVLQCTV